MNALVYVNIDQGIHKGKNESCLKWKTKKTTWVFFLYEYRKFWSISSEFKLERKTFILEVCIASSRQIRHTWLLIIDFYHTTLTNEKIHMIVKGLRTYYQLSVYCWNFHCFYYFHFNYGRGTFSKWTQQVGIKVCTLYS